MYELLETLNPQQKEAAMTIDQNVRIIAGAGSGKTRVLMNRIASLIQDAGILPWRIMAITFTNKAAREMKDRLEELIGCDARDVRISTIHSLCVRILREDSLAAGFPKNFTILDGDDQKSILRPFYKEMEIDKNQLPQGKVLSLISNWKTAGFSPEKAKKAVFTIDQRLCSELYEQYEAAKDDMKAMDFDDLLVNARNLLAKNEDVRQKWQKRLDYIHVDEFQDVDENQYEIIRLLTGDDTKLCVVGDPDQTIYTWRGASVDIILRFDKDFPDTRTIVLNQNYRSTKPILSAANAVIGYNRDRIKKDLFTDLPGDDLIEEFEGKEENQEPLQTARDIMEARKQGLDWKDIAVLYRSNYVSRSFERIFRKLNIPYVIYGGIRFYERAEIKDMLSYLKLLCDPDEDDPAQKSLDLAVQRILNVPRRGIGARTIEKLQAEASQRGINLLECLRDPQTVSSAAARKLAGFAELIDELKEAKTRLPLHELLELAVQESGYAAMLKDNHEDERMDNIQELVNDILEAGRENPDMTLESYLQDISLFTDRMEESTADTVSLMTVHAAKGLEFRHVHLVSFNEDIFPSRRALEDGGRKALEEERRLLYVAMTRAKEKLFLSWNLGYSYVNDGYKLPSRFLKEIPDQWVKQEQTPLAEKPAASAKKPLKPRKDKLRKGDLVEHIIYGQGVILDLKGDIASIAFAKPHGVKKLNINHPSLQRQTRS